MKMNDAAPDRGQRDEPRDVCAPHRQAARRAGVRPRRFALEREQRALALEPARVAGQRAVGADDPMARDDDRQRIAAGRRARGADAARAAGARARARGRRSSRRTARRRSLPTPRAGTACLRARAADRTRARSPAKYSASCDAAARSAGWRSRRARHVGARSAARSARPSNAMPASASPSRDEQHRAERRSRCDRNGRWYVHACVSPEMNDGVGAPRAPRFAARERARRARSRRAPCSTTRSLARNASGQRSARIAM